MTEKPELITSERCPFGLACAGIMLIKGIQFELKLVESDAEFQAMGYPSPFGSVPLLRHGEFVLFDSIAIVEYLADQYPLELHPADPKRRAISRAWLQQSSNVTKSILNLALTAERPSFEEHCRKLNGSFARISAYMDEGPFFNGASPSIIDAAFQPFLSRHAALESFLGYDPIALPPKVIQWRNAVNDTIGKTTQMHSNQGVKFMEYVFLSNPYLDRFRNDVS